MLPNFIIGGGVASGTSFLSHSIQNHPEIYLPRIMRPECGFFYKSWEYERGLGHYSQKWFSEAKNQKAVGERSSLYLHGGFLGVPTRIKKALPEVKLIFCLRNPTERAYANYRFSVLSGFESLTFEEALELEQHRFSNARGWKAEIQPNLYKSRGDYEKELRPFLELFPREQILLIKSESLSRDSKREIQRVYDFLGVRDHEYEKSESFPSFSVRSRRYQKVLRKTLGSRMDTLTENTRSGSGESSAIDFLVRINLKGEKTQMKDSTRNLLNEFYERSNKFVSELTGWNLEDWK